MKTGKLVRALICAAFALGVNALPSGVVFTLSAEAAYIIDNGTCGKNAVWELDRDGTLTVSGTGDMYSRNSNYDIPWEEEKESIKKVVISKGITSVGSQSFDSCTNLESVAIADTVTSIETYSFSGCRALTSLVVPNSVTNIGSSAFAMCKSLSDVTIPSSVTYIGALAFTGTPWLNAEAKKSQFVIVNGLLLFAVDREDVVIPDSVTYIVSDAFWGKSLMKTLTIPDTVTGIGHNAFASCSSLTSVTIPESVEDIGVQAFANCAALGEVTILAPDAKIYDRATTFANDNISYSGVIRGYDGSTAEIWAGKYGYRFESLGERPAEYSFGDVNGDGVIDAVDASEVLAYYARVSTDQDGGFGIKQQAAADVDMNGFIDSVDASDILAYYAYVSTAEGKVLSMEEYMKKK